MSETSPNKILIDNFNKLIICKEDELSSKEEPKEKNAIRFKINSFRKFYKIFYRAHMNVWCVIPIIW